MIKVAFPHPPGSGGPGSFQVRFENELKKKDFKVIYSGSKETPNLIFVVGGTRRILWLLKCKINRIPIVYRLDGINWLHRKSKSNKTIKSFLLAERANFNIKLIHAFLADHIVYQSQFVKEWWEHKGWRRRKEYSIIYNGVDQSFFVPRSDSLAKKPTLICLEGSLDYSPYAIELINQLYSRVSLDFNVYGGIRFAKEKKKLLDKVNYLGRADPEDLPSIYQNGIYLSLDVNAACPNTVIESLSCGSPVVGFQTGSLNELVSEEAGIIVPYGGDAWKLDFPDVDALVTAIEAITLDYKQYSLNARRIAEEKYSIDDMMDKYLNILGRLK